MSLGRATARLQRRGTAVPPDQPSHGVDIGCAGGAAEGMLTPDGRRYSPSALWRTSDERTRDGCAMTPRRGIPLRFFTALEARADGPGR